MLGKIIKKLIFILYTTICNSNSAAKVQLFTNPNRCTLSDGYKQKDNIKSKYKPIE